MAVGPGDDLGPGTLAAALPDRPVRTYPALVATQADALSWARSGGAAGAVVVADYQAAPRGRAGLEWQVTQGRGLGFSLVVRPQLPAEREGWLYVAASTGLADLLGEPARLEWPDEVHVDDQPAARLGVHAELGVLGVEWAVATVLIEDVEPPRGPLLARAVAAIEARLEQDAEAVLADYLPRCDTIGRRVQAKLIPMGPAGEVVTGEAVDCNPDGALVLRTDAGRRVGIRPHHLGVLEPADP